MRFALAFLLMLATLAQAQPSISSAVLNGSTITISGSSFGTKSTAAPHKFQPFTTTTQGQEWDDVGFDFFATGASGDTPGNTNECDMTDGVGGGSWMHGKPDNNSESFTHFGHNLPAANNALYVSYWVKITRIGTPTIPGGFWQYKGIRSGPRRGSDPIADMYQGPIYFNFSHYTPNDPLDALSGPTAYTGCGEGCGTTTYPDPPGSISDVQFINGEWHFCEIYYQMDDFGMANGLMQVRFDGTQHHNLTGLTIKTAPTDYLGYVQYNPGFAHDEDLAGAVWEGRYSRIYTDITRSRVFLGNASSLASCTGRFLLPPSAWSTTAITVTNATSIPSGYNWVYVSDSNGQINATGYAYTTGPAERRYMCCLFLRQ
jgi:hypothetical protein